MSDIVERLRDRPANNAMLNDSGELYGIEKTLDCLAADEIERLRAENATLRQALKNHAEEAVKMVNAEPVGEVERFEDASGHLSFIAWRGVSPPVGTKLYTSPRIPDGWKHCPQCGTHEVSLSRTCHNSSCSSYAEDITVYEGWRDAAAPKKESNV